MILWPMATLRDNSGVQLHGDVAYLNYVATHHIYTHQPEEIGAWCRCVGGRLHDCTNSWRSPLGGISPLLPPFPPALFHKVTNRTRDGHVVRQTVAVWVDLRCVLTDRFSFPSMYRARRCARRCRRRTTICRSVALTPGTLIVGEEKEGKERGGGVNHMQAQRGAGFRVSHQRSTRCSCTQVDSRALWRSVQRFGDASWRWR